MAPGQPPLANMVTLGVRDFGARRDFYRRLGWPQVLDADDLAVFELRGALLALFPADKLAVDARAEPEAGGGGIGFAIIISVDSPDEVDELADHVRRAGGTLTKDPVDAEFFTAATPTSPTRKATTGRSPGRPRTTRCPPQPAAPPAS